MNITSLARFRGRAAQVGEQAIEAAEQVQDELAERVLELRRSLADRIDPDPAPRRMRRWLFLGVLVLALGVVAGAWAAWQRRQNAASMSSNGQHPDGERAPVDPTITSAGNGVSAEAK